MNKVNVLFCCMANICRSPMAEGALRELVTKAGYTNQIYIDSAGTHAHVLGRPPDPRAQRVMLEMGVDIGGLRSRRISRSDFQRFDHILAMDAQNYDTLRFICPRGHVRKIRYLLDFAPHLKMRDVPDPYHGEEAVFRETREMIVQAVEGVFAYLLDMPIKEK